MKKIIILAIATLSTGIVLSSNLKKNEAATKPTQLNVQKDDAIVQAKSGKTASYDAVATGD